MNAAPTVLQQQAQSLSEAVTQPIPGSRKIFVQGSRADLQVPMREIALTRTPTLFGGEDNAPLSVYDTSGPYTDPHAAIDLVAGLAPLRARWIAERGDTVALDGLSSSFGRGREHDARLDAVRFPARRLPRVAREGANVTQMHYARRGIITRKWSSWPSAKTSAWKRWPTRCCASSIRAKPSVPRSSNASHRNSCVTKSHAAARSCPTTSITRKASR